VNGEWKLKMENGEWRMEEKGWKIKIENGFWKLIPFSIFNFQLKKRGLGMIIVKYGLKQYWPLPAGRHLLTVHGSNK
jgi:hypothetical protein